MNVNVSFSYVQRILNALHVHTTVIERAFVYTFKQQFHVFAIIIIAKPPENYVLS